MINNPGNIRGKNGAFNNYSSPEEGYNALLGDITAKVSGNSPAMASRLGEGYQPTIRNILGVYAPPTENDTNNYVNFVATKSGISPDQPLSVDDVNKIVPHMVTMEKGAKEAQKYKQYADAGNIMNDATPDNTFTVVLPDGTEVGGIPVGTTKQQIQEKLSAKGYKFDAPTQQLEQTPATTPKQNPNDMGAFAAGVQGFNSTIPFGNKITAGAAALTQYPIAKVAGLINGSDVGLSDLYGAARDKQAATELANPTASNVGLGAGVVNNLPMFFTGLGAKTIAGAAAPKAVTSAGNAISKGTAALGDWTGSGKLAGRVVKGAAANSAMGAVYGAGQNDDALKGAKHGAIVGGVVGGAAPIAGKAIGAIAGEVKSLLPKVAETGSALRSAASPYFKAFTESGAAYSPKLTNEIADIAESSKVTGIAGKTKATDDSFNSVLDYYSGLRGQTLKPADIQKLDQSLADDISRFNRSGEYNYGRILNNIKYELRDKAFNAKNAVKYVTNGSPEAVNNLIEGNRLWSQSYKAKDIEKILQKAQGTENPQTSIRTGIKNLLANDKKMANYTPREKAELEFAMKRGAAGGLVKLFGGRFTDSVAGGIAGMSAGGPVGAVVGSLAGKAVGGAMADVAGGIQANRLRGALSNIQTAKPIPQIPSPTMAQLKAMPPAQANAIMTQIMRNRINK